MAPLLRSLGRVPALQSLSVVRSPATSFLPSCLCSCSFSSEADLHDAVAPRERKEDIMPSVEELLKEEGDDDTDRNPNRNAEITLLPREVNKHGQSYGLGKRKSAIARAWLKPGSGEIMVNGKTPAEYFGPLAGKLTVTKPFAVTATVDQYDIHCTVKGGGTTGQADAVGLAISRAIQNYDPPKRIALKMYNLLTRDSREVERKKPGKAKARKSYQWVKR